MNDNVITKSFGEKRILQFTPTLFSLFGKLYPEKITIRRIIRFLFALPDGYKIYYLTKENKTIAYCVVQSGKSKRFNFVNNEDIIIGPILVLNEFRGKGVATELIKSVLALENNNYNQAYCYIKKENQASINTFKKVGFIYYSDAILSPVLCNVKISNSEKSKHLIMKFNGGKI